jgi:membrane-associated phospholipid phosphatase
MKLAAQTVSVLFHPLLMLSYGLLLLAYANPYIFDGYSLSSVLNERFFLFVQVLASTFLFPVLAVFIMRMLDMVKSFQLHDKTERIGPYIAAGTCYLSTFYTFYRINDVPLVFQAFTLGATIALFTAFVVNIFMKVSMHTVGAGGLVAMAILTLGQSYNSIVLPTIVIFLLAGLTGTARLYLKAHSEQEVYIGYAIGFIAQLMAMNIMAMFGMSDVVQ